MNKSKILLSIVALCGMSITLHAQDYAVSNHSLSVDVFGLEYGYEQALTSHWTMIGRIGFTSMVTEAGYNEGIQLQSETKPALSLETRYYTTLTRRFDRGRSTLNNSSDFIMLRLTGAHMLRDVDPLETKAIIAYGLRRSGKHLFIEPTFGAGYHSMPKQWAPHLQIRLGLAF
jgi:hypothetical protein